MNRIESHCGGTQVAPKPTRTRNFLAQTKVDKEDKVHVDLKKSFEQ
jgi:hypothetical protein